MNILSFLVLPMSQQCPERLDDISVASYSISELLLLYLQYAFLPTKSDSSLKNTQYPKALMYLN